MADRISTSRRSWVMAQVKSRNTKPERVVRSLLHRLGYRFTVNGPKNRQLPGKPDIALPRHRLAVFVHGCFWHRHPACPHATTPKSNQAYWEAKFARNRERDRENQRALQALGWRWLVVWECQLKRPEEVAARLVAELPRRSEEGLPEELEEAALVAETQARYGRPAKGAGRRG